MSGRSFEYDDLWERGTEASPTQVLGWSLNAAARWPQGRQSEQIQSRTLVPRPRCDSALLRQRLAGIDRTDGDLRSPNTARQQGL